MRFHLGESASFSLASLLAKKRVSPQSRQMIKWNVSAFHHLPSPGK
ncbi:MAG: hypothetical protein ACRD1Z_07910 [Vicinamibacteria bacterium]